jgi:hypothetical protein
MSLTWSHVAAGVAIWAAISIVAVAVHFVFVRGKGKDEDGSS